MQIWSPVLSWPAKDNAGTEFLLAFPANRLLVEYPVARIQVSSRSRDTSDVTISMPLMDGVPDVALTLKPGEFVHHDILFDYQIQDTGNDIKGIQNYFHYVGDNPWLSQAQPRNYIDITPRQLPLVISSNQRATISATVEVMTLFSFW